MGSEPYKVLGVAQNASAQEIQRAYRKLAKANHPDANPGDRQAEERFKKASVAYGILKDPETRRRYDRGEIDENGNERVSMGGFHRSSGWPGGGGGGTGFDPGGFGGFDHILNDLFGGKGGGAGRSRNSGRGGDIRVRAAVDFITAAKGGSQRMKLNDGRNIDMNIPPGTESGQQLRLRGKGQTSMFGGDPGDLLVEIEVRPHPKLRREGFDILVDQPIPLATAVLGGKIRVSTIDGDVALNIPAWSSSGKTMRMKGRGIENRKTGGRGDQMVRLLITLPDQRDAALEALFKDADAKAA